MTKSDEAARSATAQDAARPCPYCGFDITEGSPVVVCQACAAPHHEDCWRDNGGCARQACERGQASAAVAVDESAGRRAPAPPSLAANPQPIARSVPGRARSTRANVVVAAAVVAVLAGGALTALLVNGSKTEPQGRAALVVVTGPLFTGVETYSTVAPAQPPLPLPATPASGPVAVIRSHYDHIAAGEFGAAFNLFTRSYRSSVPNWVSIRAAAQPRIHVTGLTLVSGDGGTARVQVKLYARDSSPVAGSDTQCRRFEGVVVLKREEGAWRYSPADNPLHGFVLPDSNSNCPDRG